MQQPDKYKKLHKTNLFYGDVIRKIIKNKNDLTNIFYKSNCLSINVAHHKIKNIGKN